MSNVAEESRGRPAPHRSPTSRGSTKDAILDAAEELFAADDVDAVTMRAVAERASVDPASITYHFGSKRDVIDALVRRRYIELRERRLSALTHLLAEAEEIPTARALLDTVFRPWFEVMRSGDPGWVSYANLIAQFPASPVVRALAVEHSGQWEHTLRTALSRAYPQAGEKLVEQAFRLALGVSLSLTSRLHMITKPHADPLEPPLSYPTYLTFITAGFEGVVSEHR